MGQPAARITDMHVCPMVTPGVPPIPHVGGPIISPCAPTVLIGGLPGARITDMCICVGPPDIIVKGSATVLVSKLPAARIGDNTAHGGVIVAGLPTVLIGDAGGGAVDILVAGMVGVMQGAAKAGTAVAGAMTGILTSAEQLLPGLAQAEALGEAARTGAPFCQRCAEAAAQAAAATLHSLL